MTDVAVASIVDLETIGEKIVEMAERVKAANDIRSGAQARWVIEMDDVLYRVVVSLEDLGPRDGERVQ